MVLLLLLFFHTFAVVTAETSNILMAGVTTRPWRRNVVPLVPRAAMDPSAFFMVFIRWEVWLHLRPNSMTFFWWSCDGTNSIKWHPILMQLRTISLRALILHRPYSNTAANSSSVSQTKLLHTTIKPWHSALPSLRFYQHQSNFDTCGQLLILVPIYCQLSRTTAGVRSQTMQLNSQASTLDWPGQVHSPASFHSTLFRALVCVITGCE